MSSVVPIRERLTNFYNKYAPEKLANLDRILEAYKGKEEKLMQDLVGKYGPEPPAGTPSSSAPASAQQPTSPAAAPSAAAAGSGGAIDVAAVRARLTRFYQHYAPDKLATTEKIMEHYRGKEDRLMVDLVAKYGPEPPAAGAAPPPPSSPATSSSGVPSGSSYSDRLTRFYTKYAPEKLSNVPLLLEKFKGKEESMMEELVKKYGPEPAAPAATGAPTSDPAQFRARLGRFLERYSPERLPQLDALTNKYMSQQNELMKSLVDKFGPEPPADGSGAVAATAPPATTTANTTTQQGGAAVATTPTTKSTLTPLQRVEALLQRYAPDKVQTAGTMLSKYVGREEELIDALVKRLGPEPPQSTTTQSSASGGTNAGTPPVVGPSDYRTRLTRLFTKYAPAKLDQVTSLLAKYAGREDEMLKALVSQLGPEPGPTEDLSAASVKLAQQQAKLEVSSASDLLKIWEGQNGVELVRRRFIDDPAQSTSTQAASTGSGEAGADPAAAAAENVFLLAACVVRMAAIAKCVGAPNPTSIAIYRALSIPPSSTPTPPLTKDEEASLTLPSFIQETVLRGTVQRANDIAALVASAEQALEDVTSASHESAADIAKWESEDRNRVHKLLVDRRTYQRQVIERAFEMIHDIESTSRSDLWKVQEIEANGRLQWFRHRRREIGVFMKPPELEVAEKRFDQWRGLMDEQRRVITNTDVAVRMQPITMLGSPRSPRGGSGGDAVNATPRSSHSYGRGGGGGSDPSRRSHHHIATRNRTPSPYHAHTEDDVMNAIAPPAHWNIASSSHTSPRTPAAAGALATHDSHFSSGSHHRGRDHKHQRYDYPPLHVSENAATSPPPQQQLRPRSITPKRGTPRRLQGVTVSPAVLGLKLPPTRYIDPYTGEVAVATSPRRESSPTGRHRSPGATSSSVHPKRWGLSTPRHTLQEHPSKMKVRPSGLPPRIHIAGTVFQPFSFSSPTVAGLKTKPPR